MEYQSAKSHGSPTTLLQKIFQNHDITTDLVQSSQMSSLLKSIHPDIEFDEKELNQVIAQYDQTGSGYLDFDSIARIAFHFLLKMVINECSENPDCVGLKDFVVFPQM